VLLKAFARVLPFAAVLALLCCRANAQRTGPQPPTRGISSEAPGATADLAIALEDGQKGAFLAPAKITLKTSDGELRGTVIAEKGRAIFRSLPLGTYDVSVELAGQPATHSTVSLALPGEARTLEILVNAANSGSASAGAPPADLTLREQKELTAGIRALQAQRVEEARKHFLSAAKTAPNHPDVDYLLGVVASMTGDAATAKQYFENAATRYQHVRSLTALGETYLVEGNLSQANAYLEKALLADPNCWRADQLLAAVALRQQAYPRAVRHAERALQLGKADAKGAQLTLAQALSASGEYARSTQILTELLQQNPSEDQSKEAHRLLSNNLAASRSPAPSEVSAASFSTSSSAWSLTPLPLAPTLPRGSGNPLSEHIRWVPPNVDDSVPPVEKAASCPLPHIVEQAGQRVLELVDNLERFTATEKLDHQTLNELGLAVRVEQRNFEYLVIIREVKPGIFDVSEFRDGSDSREIFPENVATLGTIALVFVFHPNYANDFDFQCEGQSHQGNQLVWQVRFQQKPGVPSRLRSYRLGTKYHRVGLKGRAWIAADTFEVLRMESDLVNQVPDLRLNAEHQDITYGPVPFQKRKVTLWLPYSAETYLDFNGHRIHRRQDLSNYMLFWVDDRQQIDKPKESETPQTASPSGSL
jgi:tetratricopeptide (TPR) repeat protein